jgi:hypothetical protein
MTKTLSMVSHKYYNLNAKWGFCHFLTSKLITCFIDGFTSRRKSQSIAYLLNGSEHIYWILDLETEVHSIWVIWTSKRQECQGQARVGQARVGQARVGGPRLWLFLCYPCPRVWRVQRSSGVFREPQFWCLTVVFSHWECRAIKRAIV